MQPKRSLSTALGFGVVFLFLNGCGGDDEERLPEPVDPKALQIAAQRGDGIDPAVYAGDVALKVPTDLPTGNGALPIMFYSGLSAETETRMDLRAFVDLRSVQSRLPDLVSGVVDETCKYEISLNLVEAVAEGELVHARGTVRAKLFSCNRRDPANEEQGFRWLTQDVDVVATAKAAVIDQCIRFSLVNLELDPRGFIGGVANLFGLTNIARSAILQKAETFFLANPICPNFPSELSSLAPDIKEGGMREIGDRGIGVAVSGSVDTSASTMISLLALMQERKVVEGAE